MRKRIADNKNIALILMALGILMLFFPVGALMGHVEKLLNEDTEVNLSEIVTQNKNVIQSKISVELNNLNVISTQVVNEMKRTNDFSQEKMGILSLNIWKGNQIMYL